MSEPTQKPVLTEETRKKIEDRREGLQAVVDSDGPFSPHARRLLELVDKRGSER